MLCIDELKDIVTDTLVMQFAEQFIVTDFLEIVGEVYATTNDAHTDIRMMLVNAAASQMDALVGRGDFKRLMEEHGEFSSALVITMHSIYCPEPSVEGAVDSSKQEHKSL